jgi:hypothetical protein
LSAGTPAKTIFIPGELCRAGKEFRMMLDPAGPIASAQVPDPILVKAIVKAGRLSDRLVHMHARPGMTSRARSSSSSVFGY